MELITAEQAAKECGVEKKTFLNWRSMNYRGARNIKKLGKKFFKESVEDFIKLNLQNGTG